MSTYVAINRDFTATVPDGDVNRHVSVRLEFDPATGAVRAVPALDAARAAAGLPPAEPSTGAASKKAG